MPDDGPWTIRVDWGDGSTPTVFDVGGLGPCRRGHLYGDDGVYNVSVTATDDGAVSAARRFRRLSPTLGRRSPSPVPARSERQAYTLTLGAVEDPGADAVSQYVVRWGDGSSDTLTAAELAAAGRKVSHVYVGGGNPVILRTITIDLADEDGLHTAVYGKTVGVGNGSPIVSPPSTQTAVEGSATSFTLGSFIGAALRPRPLDGDGGLGRRIGGHDLRRSDRRRPARQAARLRRRWDVHRGGDGDRPDGVASVPATFQAQVANVAPTLPLTGAASTVEGSSYELTLGAVADPGADVVSRYTIHWGDGTSETYTAAQVSAAGGRLSHVFADGSAGGTSRAITLDLQDEEGTYLAAAGKAVTVANATPGIAPAGNHSAVKNESAVFNLGTLTDGGLYDGAWTLAIDWGDGTSESTSVYKPGPLLPRLASVCGGGDVRGDRGRHRPRRGDVGGGLYRVGRRQPAGADRHPFPQRQGLRRQGRRRDRRHRRHSSGHQLPALFPRHLRRRGQWRHGLPPHRPLPHTGSLVIPGNVRLAGDGKNATLLKYDGADVAVKLAWTPPSASPTAAASSKWPSRASPAGRSRPTAASPSSTSSSATCSSTARCAPPSIWPTPPIRRTAASRTSRSRGSAPRPFPSTATTTRWTTSRSPARCWWTIPGR